MPLDREKGEVIGDLGSDYIIGKIETWAPTDMFVVAYSNAIDAFIACGAVPPISIKPEDVMIQEYPSLNKLAFLFQRRIAGKEHFYPFVFDLPMQMIRDLRASGKWGHKH